MMKERSQVSWCVGMRNIDSSMGQTNRSLVMFCERELDSTCEVGISVGMCEM